MPERTTPPFRADQVGSLIRPAALVEARRAAEAAVARLGGRDHLVGDTVTLADVALASMSAPLAVAVRSVREDPAVKQLLAWSNRVLEMQKEFLTVQSVTA